MNRTAYASFAAAVVAMAATPASAVTNENGQILITQAAVNAGGITPGDTPGFPATINVAGSYRLASNLTVTTAVNGIEVRANEVTIDMGGFTLAGSGVGRNGITSFNRSLTVQNGTVRGFTLDGIRTIAPYLLVDRMRIVANGRNGIVDNDGDQDLYNSRLTVTNSTVSENANNGIYCGGSCRIDSNDVSKNGFGGVLAYGPSQILGNLIVRNGTYGIFGSGGETGFGNNTLEGNSTSASGVVQLFPNFCSPAC